MVRILILDDDEFFSHMLTERLEDNVGIQFHVDQSSSLTQALNFVHQSKSPYTVFLVDHNLRSNVTGIEAMQQLMALSPDTETILFTGYNEPELGLSAYQAGAYRYLPKPFETRELVWIIESLHGINVLHELGTKTQAALSLNQVAQIFIEDGVRLGFDRARLHLIEDNGPNEPIARGVGQFGIELSDDISTLRYSCTQSAYIMKSAAAQDVIFYKDQELGPGYLATHDPKYKPPLGEWVDIPLRSEGKCIGILTLDNVVHARSIHAEQRRLLRLFGRQAAAALSRALLYEEERYTAQATDLTAKITKKMGNADEPNSLDTLLMAICDEFAPIARAGNFIVVLRDKDSPQWVYERIHTIQDDIVQEPRWRRLDDESLTSHVVLENRRIFLPNADSYRRSKQLKTVGDHPAQSWMGVPLEIGDQVIGAIILEHDEETEAFSPADFKLLEILSLQLAGVIQTAWLYERERIQVAKLNLIQRVSEQLMILAEQREEWLWHAVLTVATADYGYGFDRALLFMLEADDTLLRGHTGIGHFDQQDAMRGWEKDATDNIDFDLYLHRLQSDTVNRTKVEGMIKGWQIRIGSVDGAFQKVVKTGSIIQVLQSECHSALPPEFIQKFKPTHYSIVPVRAGQQIIGLLVLDNIWGKNPQELGALQYIGRLTDQAALIYRNLKTSNAQVELVETSNPILAQASQIPLRESLGTICHEIKEKMDADIVAIYPLERDGEEASYSLDSAAWLGMSAHSGAPIETYRPKSLTARIMNSDTLAINRISDHSARYDSQFLQDHPVIRQDRIQSLIGVPLKGIVDAKDALGILYIDYRKPREFTVNVIQLAKSFGQLASLVIRQASDYQSIETAKRAREQELRLIEELLREALTYQVDERKLIELLLRNTVELFRRLNVTPMLVTREWHRTPLHDAPTRVRRQYYFSKHRSRKSPPIVHDIYRGISGLAFEMGTTQYAPDITEPEWRGIYYKQNPSTRSELCIPLKLDDQILGVLCLESTELNAFAPEHIAIAERLAATAALALDNHYRQQRLSDIAKGSTKVAAPTNLRKTLVKITEVVQSAVPDVSAMAIWHREGDSQGWRLGYTFGLKDIEIYSNNSNTIRKAQVFVSRTAKRRNVLWAEEVHDYPRNFSKEFIQREAVQSAAAFPLHVGGQDIGVMYFHYRHTHKFTAEEKSLFEILADSVAVAINDSLHLYEVTKERRRLDAAQKITHAIGTSIALDKSLTAICQELRELYKDKYSFPLLMLYNSMTHLLETVPGVQPSYKINNPDFEHLMPLRTLAIDQSSILGTVAQRVLSHGNTDPIYLSNVNEHKNHLRLRMETLSMICVPLLAEDENDDEDSKQHPTLLGILSLESPQPDTFSIDDLKDIQSAARNISIAIERAQRLENIRFQSNVIGATVRLNPILHSVNSEIGKIRSRLEQLKQNQLTEKNQYRVNKAYESVLRIIDEVTTAIPLNESLTCIELATMLQRIVKDAQESRSIQARIVTEFEPSACYFLGHPFAFHRAFNDLVRNAFDAMGSSVQQYIKISSKPALNQQYLEIYIENSGSPIRADNQHRLFNEPFSTKSRRAGERGMGLLFVRAAIEGMGGRVRLHSSTVQATTFVITVQKAEILDS